ncbi:MAG: hydrogenase formation protein HypD [Bacillota bacterium]
MNYIDEYQDEKLAAGLLKKINEIKFPKKIKIMEVCGSHTMAIYKYGIKSLISDKIELISGPGCPVCVTAETYINKAISLARKEEVILTTFGDLLRVPANNSSLIKEMSKGSNVRIVYSPLEAVDIARNNPDKEVIFLAIGFETTIPSIALSVKKAEKLKLTNFSLLQSLKIMPPVLKQLLIFNKAEIDGFILPGHVSSIIGSNLFSFLADDYDKPSVVAGFEPLDIIISIYYLTKMMRDKSNELLNSYGRLVKSEGNKKARNLINEMFTSIKSYWRGMGVIENSGLELKDEYAEFSAEHKFEIKNESYQKDENCICGEIIVGKKQPVDCKLFSKVCTPVNPVGPCMVSSEGSCSAHYLYNRKDGEE